MKIFFACVGLLVAMPAFACPRIEGSYFCSGERDASVFIKQARRFFKTEYRVRAVGDANFGDEELRVLAPRRWQEGTVTKDASCKGNSFTYAEADPNGHSLKFTFDRFGTGRLHFRVAYRAKGGVLEITDYHCQRR